MIGFEMEADMQRDMECMKVEVGEMFKKHGVSKEDAVRLIALIKAAY